MFKFLGRWFEVYEDEIELFLWTLILLFLVRGSGILLNNFAETAFLKRYGVEYMPVVNMVNAVVTFFVMGVMAGLMIRMPGARLLAYLFIFCGSSIAAIRMLIPLGIELLYPLLFMLKAQYEVLQAMLFWNLANDLFNTRQSKRLFPLITAGGVIGMIIGSFGTPLMLRWLAFDDLTFVYLGITLLGALIVHRMGRRFPTLLVSQKKGPKSKARGSIIDELRKIAPLVKESTLVKILIALTLLPNVAIPIMNYQFNFAIDENFATEGGMIQFFGYFRGVLNIISLFILLFVGKIYGRWGLPVALMFHPCNYVLAFSAFLLRFDVFSAIYARMSTNILKTTINIPARAVVMGLVPSAERALLQPFLRGTAVRLGLLLGSGFILLSEGLFHPRYLSLVAMPFVLLWLLAPFILKRRYSRILLDLISRNMLDFKTMEDADLGPLFRDRKIQDQLLESFRVAKGESCVWYARLLKSMQLPDLDGEILALLPEQNDKTRMELLELLTTPGDSKTMAIFSRLAYPVRPEMTPAVIRTANRLARSHAAELNRWMYRNAGDPQSRGLAVAGLYQEDRPEWGGVIDGWLASERSERRLAGLVAAGQSGEESYAVHIRRLLAGSKLDENQLPEAIEGLRCLQPNGINGLIEPYLDHHSKAVRLAALHALQIEDDLSLRRAVSLMGDRSEALRSLACTKIESAPHHNGPLLIESLNIPQRRVREGIFTLLESLNVKDLDVFRFARQQIEHAYRLLAEEQAVRELPAGTARDLLTEHLEHERQVHLENVIRVLATQDRSGQMRIVHRGIFSTDSRQRANSQEALENLLDRSLSRILLPLMEVRDPGQTLWTGRRLFELPDFSGDPARICDHLLTQKGWITATLTLYMLARQDLKTWDRQTVDILSRAKNPHVRQMAVRLLQEGPPSADTKENGMESEITISDRILHLKMIEIFKELSVSELAAVSSVTEEISCPPGEEVIREGESGDTMYLIINGEVSVLKNKVDGGTITLDRIGAGEYFGEMALFEDVVRSATIRTEQETRLLVLNKQEFKEIVREYPQIALHICTVLGRRIRKLHDRVQAC